MATKGLLYCPLRSYRSIETFSKAKHIKQENLKKYCRIKVCSHCLSLTAEVSGSEKHSSLLLKSGDFIKSLMSFSCGASTWRLSGQLGAILASPVIEILKIDNSRRGSLRRVY
jgi:hypothetical protein